MLKKLLFSIVLYFITISGFSQIVNIPDANFKAALVANTSINTNNDTEIQVSEASSFDGFISVSNLNISDLTGIEAFPQITYVVCSDNQLTSLDLSQNPLLVGVDCENNDIDTLNLSQDPNTTLINFNCSNNNLSTLNVSQYLILDSLRCANNELSSLDVTQNINLSLLDFTSNNISTFDVTQNTALVILECDNNPLGTIDVSANTALIRLLCDNSMLTALDVTQNTALTRLECYNNPLIGTLDVSQNVALTRLYCYSNGLSTLDVSQNLVLGNLDCRANDLVLLDVSLNTALVRLYCTNNELTSINLANTNNTNVYFFKATSNPNLTCIEVDSTIDLNNPPVDWEIEASAQYSYDCDNLSISESNLSNINIYPNPFNSQLTIKGLDQALSTEIYNVLGKLVLSTTSTIIDTSVLASGLYLVKVTTETGTITKKLIKQ